MRSFFFWNDGIVLDHSVHSHERTIIPQEQPLALAVKKMVENTGGGFPPGQQLLYQWQLPPSPSEWNVRQVVREAIL